VPGPKTAGRAAVSILIPAAGASRRMGGTDKLVESVGGEPILRRTVRMALECSDQVFVTLPAQSHPFAPARLATLADLAAHCVIVPDAAEGMSASLRAGALAAGAATGLMIVLPDMPAIDASDIRALIDSFLMDPLVPLRAATHDGRVGHPVIFPQALLGEMAKLSGDTGARSILESRAIRLHSLPDQRAVIDLDTPQDWRRWRTNPFG
jgi:molybdenum cofactor cytidylyltransferase